MRLALASLILSSAPMALMADPVVVTSQVRSVVLFPNGAEVTRVVTVAGGDVLIPGLPDGTDLSALRVRGGQGVSVGAVTLMDGRALGGDVAEGDALRAARDKVSALEKALAVKTDAVAQIKAGAEGARARAAFLRNASSGQSSDLIALAQTVGNGVRDAEQEALRIDVEAREAEAALDPDRRALAEAQQALAALEHPAHETDSVLVTTKGQGDLILTTFVADAGWMPSYDLRLEDGAKTLQIERYVSVHQASGEDWRGVDVTLSTARPSERGTPSEMYSEQVTTGAPQPVRPMPAGGVLMRKADMTEAASMVADQMQPQMMGPVLSYHYPAAVDLRDGVDGLRLKLDDQTLDAKIEAEAVPMYDQTAYRVVETRAGQDPLLAGRAALFVDGAMVGKTDLPFTAAGDKLRLGFGAIDGLRLKRIVPEASAGGRGIISKSNAREEAVRLSVENLTDRAWDVRLLDRVPYSEQDDLKVSYKANPAPTETNWMDRRGVLAWTFTLPAGKTQDVALDVTLNWPAGQVLQ